MVLSCDSVHAWVVIDLLIRVEFRQEIWCDTQVVPGDIPLFDKLLVVLTLANGSVVILRVLPQLVTEHFLGDLLYNIVISAVDVHVEWTTRLFFLLLFRLLVLFAISARFRFFVVLSRLGACGVVGAQGTTMLLRTWADFLIVVLLVIIVVATSRAIRLCKRVFPRVVLVVTDSAAVECHPSVETGGRHGRGPTAHPGRLLAAIAAITAIRFLIRPIQGLNQRRLPLLPSRVVFPTIGAASRPLVCQFAPSLTIRCCGLGRALTTFFVLSGHFF